MPGSTSASGIARSRSMASTGSAKRKCTLPIAQTAELTDTVPLKDFTDLKATCDRMAKQIEELVKIISNLMPGAVSPVLASVGSSSPNSPHPQIRTSHDLVREAASMMKKSKRAVIELLPDSPDNTEQDVVDTEKIKSLATKYNLPLPTAVFRHKCNSKIRPLKIEFDNSTSRDLFIRGFNKFIKTAEFASLARKPRCRRDLTLNELAILRTSRETIYKTNKEAGKSVLILNDIFVKENPAPRPFL
uniref:Uncharacterized protein n=1 Tax=Caenorhabditis japonica TaxID=281687 RepID=A0A8R1IDI7_CAEJA